MKRVVFSFGEIRMDGMKRWAMFNQARVLDKKRLTSRIGTLDEVEFKKVKDGFLKFYSSP